MITIDYYDLDHTFGPQFVNMSEEEIKEYLSLYINYLAYHKLTLDAEINYYTLDIIFEANFDKTNKDDRGAFFMNKDDYELTIIVDTNQSNINLMQSLAHELIHCRQWYEGKFKRYSNENSNLFLWDNKLYDTSKTPYLQLPWEAEAIAFEKMLCDEYIKKIA